MASVANAIRPAPSGGLGFFANFIVAFIVLLVCSSAILAIVEHNALLHTMLDTSVSLIAGLIALMFWDTSRRDGHLWLLLLAISFGLLAVGELIHVVIVLSTLGLSHADVGLRAGSWGPPSHLLPVGLLAAMIWRERSRSFAWVFLLGLLLLAIALIAFFYSIPRYTAPTFLGVTRPNLILLPILWGLVAVVHWRKREESAVSRVIAYASLIFLIGHIAMLYSQAPNDGPSMVAHLHKVVGEAFLLFSLTQIGAADSVRRGQVEQQLLELNSELDARVLERTERIRENNERMHLLEEITRAIGRRQDMASIFQVVVRTLEERMPADFACICSFDTVDQQFSVEHVGVVHKELAEELGLTKEKHFPVDSNGLSRALGGALVYEPDLAVVDFPFPKRLAAKGLRSMVLTPIPVEGEVYGLIVTARRRPDGFISTDSEFLSHLGEHVGLAAHQAQLRDRLQLAYDDLRQTQQAVLAQERLRAIGQMASGIAHDINNAISPVSVYTQSLLKHEPNLSADVRDYLEIVGRVIKDVSATVSRMRDFYRAPDEMALKPIQLNELVPQIVELTRARWNDMPQQRGVVIDVATRLDDQLPLVMGSESEIREAMTNLVFNAVDAMPEGGTITIRTERIARNGHGRPHVLLEVGDTGLGMDEEARRRCLEPFFTTKGERGTGLGLAMVYGTMQRHKARLDIDSAPGEGTRMRMEFDVAGNTQAAEAAPVAADVRSLRLLIVDDDPAVLRSTVFVLKKDGHEITSVDGGNAALDALQIARDSGESFDLVITDLGMPYVDGNQVAMRSKSLFPDTPVLLLTGWGRRMDDRDGLPPHIDFMLAKPPDLEELHDVFAKVAGAG